MFREDKATALAYVFLNLGGGAVNDLKLMKLMYMAERKSIGMFTASITGSSFCSMKHGPVLSDAYSVMTAEISSTLWSSVIEYWRHRDGAPENTFRIRKELEPSTFLSQAEIGIANEVWSDYGDKDKWSLVELTHTFPEWDKLAKDLNTSFKLELSTILKKAFQLPEEDIDDYVLHVKQFSGLAV